MSFCQQCGTEAAAATLFCASCGANVTAPDVKAHDPYAPPAATRAGLAPQWVHNFALFEQAGGVRLPLIGTLPFGDRVRLRFNIWALLFGPVYYAAKGMWRKALSLSLALMVLLVIVELAADLLGMRDTKINLISNIVFPLVFAMRANIDYYKKMVLDDNGWW